MLGYFVVVALMLNVSKSVATVGFWVRNRIRSQQDISVSLGFIHFGVFVVMSSYASMAKVSKEWRMHYQNSVAGAE